MKEDQYKVVWIAGHEEGVATLLEQITAEVTRKRGPAAILGDTAHVMELDWFPGRPSICIAKEKSTCWIKMEDSAVDPEIWNETIESFHSQIIEPIKDRVGGVASGIGYEEKG